MGVVVMLIVVEGSDGCGKSSVVTALAGILKCGEMSFPNDEGYTGKAIRAYLKRRWWVGVPAPGERDDQLGALAFQALQITNRMEVMPRLLLAAKSPLTAESLVLARYWQSGWVYGQLDGLDADWLARIHTTMAQPQVNLLLDLPAEEAMRRRAARDGALSPERYEGKRYFTTLVVSLYRDLWTRNRLAVPGRRNDWAVIDATKPLGEVTLQCLKIIHGQ